jgi:hypothetical protein
MIKISTNSRILSRMTESAGEKQSLNRSDGTARHAAGLPKVGCAVCEANVFIDEGNHSICTTGQFGEARPLIVKQ